MTDNQCTAFNGHHLIATGSMDQVATAARKVLDQKPTDSILVFDDVTGQVIEIDFRGSIQDVRDRLPAPSKEIQRGPGRPKLGVVAREVTLLPRHWDWLAKQPGGASVALRKLVETARRENESNDSVRERQEAVYRFMSVMAGNLPGFEEAIRALFAGNKIRFMNQIDSWPQEIRDYTKRIAENAF